MTGRTVPIRRGLRVALNGKLPEGMPRKGWKLGRCDYCKVGSEKDEVIPVRKTLSRTLICPNCLAKKLAAPVRDGTAGVAN